MSAAFRSGSGKRRRARLAEAVDRVNAALADPQRPSSAANLDDYKLVPKSELPRRRRLPGEAKLPRGVHRDVALSLPGGKKLFQKPGIPPSIVPGRSATTALAAARNSAARPAWFDVDAGIGDDTADSDDWDRDHNFYVHIPKESNRSRHRRRRVAQNQHWRDIAATRLPQLYLGFKHGHAVEDSPMCCCGKNRALTVMCADWAGTHNIVIMICACRPAADQLLARGYFPCAPISPSMAFNLDLLHFISIHSVLVAPNVTAWAETLETFWAGDAPQQRITGRLRKRLGMALTWYQVVLNKADHFVQSELRQQRPQPENNAAPQRVYQNGVQNDGDGVQNDGEHPARASTPAGERGDRTGLEADNRLRPSESLRQKCALCFGGEKPALEHSKAHVIVCIDANFAQKRRKCAEGEPPLEFIPSRFASEAEASSMAAEVETLQKRPAKRRRKGKSARVDDEVLDQCEKSFIAAQEKVTKASKNYFADTGLMALLCRHDRVLWVVSLSTPGERQFYALTLLRKLGEELPRDWRVGLLYDIACQLSRGIEKWGYLPEFADRFEYAVSVFHAYGHQWECQVIFHPRKCEGFGLSDGEGCERFWSSIRHLIAGLRVSGFYRRLFVLDRQMDALSKSARWKIGLWLRRKYLETQRRLGEARAILLGTGVQRGDLRAQWKLQVEAQLAKSTRQSANAGDKAIDEILVALGTVQDYKDEIRDLRKELRKAHALTAGQLQKTTAALDTARRNLEAMESRVVTLHVRLGTERCRRLEEMRGNAYVCARVNARAIRATIRANLVKHKFEHRKVERAYRHQVLEAREHSQTKDAIQRREQTLTAQVKKYNDLVDDMKQLAQRGLKPPGRSPLPRLLEAKKLFKLDVDDEIWQEDPGLGPQDERDIPRWQADENVKRGILALLEEDRCLEEMERLDAEQAALAQWWKEEDRIMREFCADSSARDSVVGAVRREWETHQSLLQVWQRDLAVCALGRRFAAATQATPQRAEEVRQSPRPPSPPEVDSDDASDAYSDIQEDDDPFLVDILDTMVLIDELGEEEEQVENAKLAQPEGDVDPQVPNDTTDGAEPEARSATVPKRKQPAHYVYRAGNFTCWQDDVDRMAKRTAWLSGAGLTVFLQHALDKTGVHDISVLHSVTLADVELYENFRADGDAARAQANKKELLQALQKVVPPSRARKWLMLGHVPSPGHWTLLEIRWAQRSIHFYDSFSRVGGYATRLERLTRSLLDICGELFGGDIRGQDFQWHAEQRGSRQTNGWDCGPFATADAVNLMTDDAPSSLTEVNMMRWREHMVNAVHSLRVLESERTTRAPVDDQTEVIEISD